MMNTDIISPEAIRERIEAAVCEARYSAEHTYRVALDEDALRRACGERFAHAVAVIRRNRGEPLRPSFGAARTGLQISEAVTRAVAAGNDWERVQLTRAKYQCILDALVGAGAQLYQLDADRRAWAHE